MPIPAQRFSFLNDETNVAVSDFQSIESNDILNSANNILADLSSDAQDFLNNGIQTDALNVKASELDFKETSTFLPIDPVTRNTKDLWSSMQDIKRFDSRSLDRQISSILPDNPVVQSSFNNISARCKTPVFGGLGLGRPFDLGMNCNGNNRSATGGACNVGQYSNILNTLTGGSYNSSFRDMNKILNQIMALSKYGFNLNMCGVFGAVTTGVTDTGVLSRASGGLLGDLASKGNVNGFMDLAAGSVGLHSLLEYPAGLSQTFSNFKIPTEFKNPQLSGLSDSFSGASHIFKDNWNKSDTDDILSVSIADDYNSDLGTVFEAKAKDKIFDIDNLDTVPDDDDSFIHSGYSAISSYTTERNIDANFLFD